MQTIQSDAGKEQSVPVSTENQTRLKANLSKPAKPGKHHYAIVVDGDNREYYVHIPKGYNGSTALPVVFMLHGSGGNGLKFYNISGWVKEGESENIITVFPSSWKYDCVIDDGIQKHNAEKWNSYDLVVCNNNKKRNDIKFLSAVIDDLKSKFAVNEKRVYLVGFSNGGEMAARCAVELSDKLAAVVACSGTLPPDATMSPVRKLPVWLQIGNLEEGVITKIGAVSPLPMDIPLLLSQYPAIQSVINSYINSFALQPAYTISGNPQKYTMAKYAGISGRPENVLNFVLVKGLNHQYANGTNHPLIAADVHWDWMKNFMLP